MTTKTIPPAPLTIEVVNTRAIEDILTRTKGFLELIETVCNAATKNDAEEIGEVFSPCLVASLAMMCCFAAQDLALMETYLGPDAASFHQNQIEELALRTPGGAEGARVPDGV